MVWCLHRKSRSAQIDRPLSAPGGKKLLWGNDARIHVSAAEGHAVCLSGAGDRHEKLCVWSMDDYNDVSTHNQYNRALADGFSPEEALRLVQLESRDNARTPFQWDATENAGFTTGKPWLKVNPNYTGLNAAQEERDEDSVLTWYKKMIGLRLHSQWSELISEGTFAPAYREEKNLIAYRRSFEGKTLLVLCNMQPEERELTLVAAPGQVLADNYKEAAFTGNTVRLRPYEVLIAEEA